MDKYLIKNVSGFNFKLELKDSYGNIIPAGIKKTITPKQFTEPKIKLLDIKWFNNFNQNLLEQVIACKKLNY